MNRPQIEELRSGLEAIAHQFASQAKSRIEREWYIDRVLFLKHASPAKIAKEI